MRVPALDRRRVARLLLGTVVLLAAVQIGLAYQASVTDDDSLRPTTLDRSVDPAGFTVVTSATGVNGRIVAYDERGTVRFRNASHAGYFDVDPSPAGSATVLYSASSPYTGSGCSDCALNVVERVNMTTGEVTRLYEQVVPYKGSVRYHDVDRLGENRLVVADISADQVFVVNTETGVREWTYDFQQRYRPASGGAFQGDWTHINDVEVLPDGRIMVSLRNQDSVVFLNRSTGVLTDWTLGSDDNHSVLYEQHNPDYIPASAGGPNVLVGDSENHRVVEYRRTANGSWERVWTWTDERLTWPRDADRLPSGHTLVTGSGSGRVLEVTENGSVVWSITQPVPYESERLGTGDESSGPTAGEANLQSRTGSSSSESESDGDESSGGLSVPGMLELWLFVKNALPGPLVNGLLFVLPEWLGTRELPALAGAVGGVGTWAVAELYWAGIRLRLPITRDD